MRRRTEDEWDAARPERHPATANLIRALIAILAMAGGAVVGFCLTLAIVVAKARFGFYIFSLSDLAELRWDTAPIPACALAGLALGIRRPHSLDGLALWASIAMLVGLGAGLLLGNLFWGTSEGRWAGSIIAGALGLFAGSLAFLRWGTQPPPIPIWRGATGTLTLVGAFAILANGAPGSRTPAPLELPEFDFISVPGPAAIDAVIFLVGDAGETVAGRSPLLEVLGSDVERWSQALANDSAVSVIFLGDLVYPVGVRERDHPQFETDSARIWNQIELLGGAHARRFASLGLFLTGNHDWGNSSGDFGFDRVLNLDQQIGFGREAGRHVSLLPPAGEPGPVVRDLRRNVRILFLDTHWFLQARSAQEREDFFTRVEAALQSAGEREVILVAHHPWASAGPHGALIPGQQSGGIEVLLKRSGTLVQDLNSPVYRELLFRLRQIFTDAPRPPLVFAGGHDHSLQVAAGAGDFDPRFMLVSGAGSKLTAVSNAPDLLWAGARPGYMMLAFREDDGVDLFVVGGDPEFLQCPEAGEARAECMAEGTAAFRIVYSATLLGPSGREVPVPAAPDTTSPRTPWWTGR